VALSACGSSSKPQYCSDHSDLEQWIKGLADVNVLQSGGVEQLKSQLPKVQSDAKTVVDSAKSDFPTETDAIQSSVSKVQSDLQSLPASPSPQQVVGVASDVKAAVIAVQNFQNATDSKCS
jgi:hypothetical protein